MVMVLAQQGSAWSLFKILETGVWYLVMWLPCHLCQTMSFDDWANMNKGLEDANLVKVYTLATTSLKTGCCIWLYVICLLLVAFGLSALAV